MVQGRWNVPRNSTMAERSGSATAGQRRMNTPETLIGGSLKPVGSALRQYLFQRAGGWYLLRCANEGDAQAQAEINVGTVSVETLDGRQVWPKQGEPQPRKPLTMSKTTKQQTGRRSRRPSPAPGSERCTHRDQTGIYCHVHQAGCGLHNNHQPDSHCECLPCPPAPNEKGQR